MVNLLHQDRDIVEHRSRSGIQSVDIALRVVRVLTEATGPMTLKDISAKCGMAPSKVHRYLQSLVAGGILSQLRRSGRYDLGNLCMRLGFVAMNRIDIINRAADHLEDLAQELGCAVALSVWGPSGVTVVRRHHGSSQIQVNFPVGSILPLLGSAAGQVFLAFLPRQITQQKAEEERLRALNQDPPREYHIDEIATRVRSQGYAANDKLIPGYAAISAPIRSWNGEACAAVTVVREKIRGGDDAMQALPRLLDICRELSVAPPSTG